ncbi:AAA family ATPase [Brevibacillus sp. GCM10020057]|uniref:AAA family ATPase n=1 Tax=Brevibacillus sp. GCM10020057 TaxID=3317327 RepID=UPI00363D33DD
MKKLTDRTPDLLSRMAEERQADALGQVIALLDSYDGFFHLHHFAKGDHVIIMINGAFGCGKTSTAQMLQPFVANSLIFDPEEIGAMIRKIIPEKVRHIHEQTDDFQDIDLWKTLTVKVAGEVKKKYQKHLIVPMTLYKEENFHYIYNGFKELDEEIYHFCLLASEDTLYNRLAKRGDPAGGWSFQQTAKCAEAFRKDIFQEHVITDHLKISEIVNIILKRINNKDKCNSA